MGAGASGAGVGRVGGASGLDCGSGLAGLGAPVIPWIYSAFLKRTDSETGDA